MKRTLLLALSAVASMGLSASAQVLTKNTALDPDSFQTPKSERHIAAWWHWMDGGITKEGITKDLEAMKEQKIQDATILNIYREIGVTEVKLAPFGSDEWYSMFKHAVVEADRLGMTIGAANCDGWSEAGGPWIKPKDSMKEYTWRKAYARGNGKTQTITLPTPFGRERYYEDAYVVAYKAPVPNSFVAAAPSASCKGRWPNETLVKGFSYQDWSAPSDEFDDFPAERLIDGDPITALTLHAGNRNIDLNFEKPFEAQILRMFVLKSEIAFPIPVEIQTSADGKSYSTVDVVYVTRDSYMQAIPFKGAKAQYWRLIVNDKGAATTLSEIELLKAGERGQYDNIISNFPAKTSFIGGRSSADYYSPSDESLKSISSTSEVIDLTGKMAPDGTLSWQVPAGDWTIIRFGYTSTAKFNHPASPTGMGLECDKMDTTALNLHFAAFPQKLIDIAGPLAGKSFKYFLIDSWEAGLQNWTKEFGREFEKRRGYSIIPWIPALCGELMVDSEQTNAFMHDFRKTIGDLIQDYFFKHFADLCHRQGMQLFSEGIYGSFANPPADVLETYKHCDVPMSEFWTRIGGRDYPYLHTPGNYTGHSVPFHASLLYDKPVIGAEAYTGMAFYSESPIDLKLYGDQILSEGVNHFILHSYVHQPDDRKPGVTLGIYGNTFNRNNSWFPYIGSFFEHIARQQYMLQSGDRRADALIFLGDKLPMVECNSGWLTANLPQNIKFNYVNQDVIVNRLSVNSKGELLLDGKHPFQFLYLRDREMDLSTLEKIEALVREGATVFAAKPSSTLSLSGLSAANESLRAIADRVWGSDTAAGFSRYGKGQVIWSNRRLREAYQPDVKVKGLDINDILYLHKTVGDKEVYYIVSKDNTSSRSFELSLRSKGVPSIWNPQDGKVSESAIFAESGDYTTIPVTLRPRQSVFVVLDTKASASDHIVGVTSEDGYTLFPAACAEDISELPNFYYAADGSIEATGAAKIKLALSSGKSIDFAGKGARSISVDGTRGTMSFLSQIDELGTMPIGGFKRLNVSKNPLIMYYSGEIAYKTVMTIPAGFIAPDRQILMNISEFGSTACIEINGKLVRTVWDPYDKVDITEFVKEGDNDLTVTVTNPYRNRLVGDKVQDRGSKALWTTSPLLQKSNPSYAIIHKDATLLPSGLSRPISVTSVPKVKVQ